MDAQAEYERVSAKYAAAGWRDAVVGLAMLAVLILADRFITVHWAFYAGAICGFIALEIRNCRLRKLARKFAESAAR